AGVEPTRISCVAALRLICDEWLWCAIAMPGAIPKHLRNLRAALKTLILPPRRSERRFPRAVKIKMSNYARKRRNGSKRSGVPLIRPALGLAELLADVRDDLGVARALDDLGHLGRVPRDQVLAPARLR